jgi:hypothetical protein
MLLNSLGAANRRIVKMQHDSPFMWHTTCHFDRLTGFRRKRPQTTSLHQLGWLMAGAIIAFLSRLHGNRIPVDIG